MSTFPAHQHPRAATGRFTAALRPQPNLARPAVTGRNTDHRTALAEQVLGDHADLEILDHSPALRETVRLAKMGDPGLALGNCSAATNELIEEAGASAFDPEWVAGISLKRRRLGSHHVALLVTDRDGTYVVDYTARQFSRDLPRPCSGAALRVWGNIMGLWDRLKQVRESRTVVTSDQAMEADDASDPMEGCAGIYASGIIDGKTCARCAGNDEH